MKACPTHPCHSRAYGESIGLHTEHFRLAAAGNGSKQPAVLECSMVEDDLSDGSADNLADLYRFEVAGSMAGEAKNRMAEVLDPAEEERLAGLSLLELVKQASDDLVGAILARLGDVRAALSGHGGGIVVDSAEVVAKSNGSEAVSLQLNLDGACIACGAAPGTLQGIQNDLLMDSEVATIFFSTSLLDTFDELGREFVLKHGNVTFVE